MSLKEQIREIREIWKDKQRMRNAYLDILLWTVALIVFFICYWGCQPILWYSLDVWIDWLKFFLSKIK